MRTLQRHVGRAFELAAEFLDEIGPELADRSGDPQVVTKPDGTPVTDADLEVHDRFVEHIARRLPGHGVLSEEGTTCAPDTEWTWIIDPIDGTANFIAGVPYWCVSVALAHGGEVVAGIVDAPEIGRRWAARRGAGTYRDGAQVRVRPTVDVGDRRNRHVPVMLTTATARRARAAGVALNVRVMGSTALDLAMVADGSAVASVAVVPHVWDVAAGVLLVTEAGGAAATPRGAPLLPLVGGVEQRNRTAVTAAAADESYACELAVRLLAEDGDDP